MLPTKRQLNVIQTLINHKTFGQTGAPRVTIQAGKSQHILVSVLLLNHNELKAKASRPRPWLIFLSSRTLSLPKSIESKNYFWKCGNTAITSQLYTRYEMCFFLFDVTPLWLT